ELLPGLLARFPRDSLKVSSGSKRPLRMSDLLDDSALANPVWSCLTTRHAHLAQGGRFAVRYPSDISPLCGMPAGATGNIEALQALVAVDDDVAVAGPQIPELPANWE